MNDCDFCDGTGWTEGGESLHTECPKCGGTGRNDKIAPVSSSMTPSEEKTEEEREMRGPERISQIVDRYWGFDDHQVHTHSWHEKQDCLEIIRKMEADIESSLSKLQTENEILMNRFGPKIVCLCGSTRFKEAFDEANYQETMAGNIILSVGFFMHAAGNRHGENIGATPEQKIALDALHKRKIDLCDEVFVLNVGDYIGQSTMSEIRYAYKIGRPIRFLQEPRPRNPENVNDPDLPQPFPWELL